MMRIATRLVAVTLFFPLFAAGAQAQALLNLQGRDHICSFAPDEVLEGDIYSFASSKQANDMVADIMSTVGLVPRFEIFAANVPNAAAVIEGQQRLIVYSESWIQNTADNNRWAAIALLGHEIAHHLNGHTLEAGGSRPPTELEADRFAGFVVGKLGGNLQEAQWLFNRLPRHGSETHPPRSARLEAVAVGWRDATGGSMNTPPAPETSQDSPSPAPSDTLVGDWFVVAGSFPHSSTSEANARLAQLRQSGLNVNLVDTDDYAQFTNGLLSVVVASDSRRRAFEELEKVKRHVPDAYVKKGN